jgi:hypothetical protein
MGEEGEAGGNAHDQIAQANLLSREEFREEIEQVERAKGYTEIGNQGRFKALSDDNAHASTNLSEKTAIAWDKLCGG